MTAMTKNKRGRPRLRKPKAKPKRTKYRGYLLEVREDNSCDIFRKEYHVDNRPSKKDAKALIDRHLVKWKIQKRV